MEGHSEDLDEDVQEQDKPTILWERCIQQSIIVDLSEDESLHLSDLESSLVLHLSQAESAASEASVHLSGSAVLSGLDESSSENCVASSNSTNAVENKSKNIMFHPSAQRPNIDHNEPSFKQRFEDPGQDTSDEDHEDLPYDDNLGSFNQASCSFENSDGGDTVHGSPDPPGLPVKDQNTNTKPDECFEAMREAEIALPTDIKHLLLRHFSKEELLRPGRLIEAETLPEVSLLDSVDDSVFSLAPTTNAQANYSSISECTQERSRSASKNENLEEKTEQKIDDYTFAANEKNMSSSDSSNRGDNSTDETEQNTGTKEEDQNQRAPLIRTRSFSEMKYGQGQVHYPLPDFSKVAPKVKIPRTPSGPMRPVLQNPNTIHGAHSSPGMLEVISRVLENSIPSSETAYNFKDNENKTPPALVHHMKTEYDKLLTMYEDSVRLMDQIGPEPNTHSLSDDAENHLEFGVETYSKHLISPASMPDTFFKKVGESTRDPIVAEETRVLLNQNEDLLSDGERITAELRKIIIQFIQKVEIFKCNVTNMTVSTAEQQMMLRRMMEAQDELERKYISKKEEHRALEMQNYMGLSRNTGTFDPDRLVEGDIFRIGMHLEDIKEIIDRNTFEQISPPQSFSTPISTTISLHDKPGSLSFHTGSPSPASSLHEGEIEGFVTESCTKDTHKKEDNEEMNDTREVHVNGGLKQSWELRTADPLKEIVGQSNNSKWSPSSCCNLLDSVEGLQCQTAEDVQETTSNQRDISAHLSGTRSTSNQRPWTADSFVLNTSSECDLGDCVSVTVEVSCPSRPPRDSDGHSISEPAVNTSCVAQRIQSPETDSGFGSSFLNQSTTEAFQPNILTGGIESKCNDLSSSDSEASRSNLETTIHTVAVEAQSSIQTLHCEAAAAAVALWVESTTKEPSRTDPVRLAQLHRHMPEPALSTTMDAADKHTPLNSCSCNSEAILALQVELSKLKKELEQGLLQLPQLAHRMDYLTSRLSSRGRSKLTSGLLRKEDWISSDLEQSKSKDSGGGICPEMLSQFPDSPVGSVCSASELQDKRQAPSKNRGTKGFSSIKEEHERHVQQLPQAIKSYKSKERLSPSPSVQKPLLQVNYGSSCSLPASYKVREPQLQSTSCHRKRSTQSDTALLPSNVYFQQTLSPVSVPFRPTSRRRDKKEEDMKRTLDQAIEVARIMKRTTDRMARRISADLAKAQLHKKLHNMPPLGGRKHHTL